MTALEKFLTGALMAVLIVAIAFSHSFGKRQCRPTSFHVWNEGPGTLKIYFNNPPDPKFYVGVAPGEWQWFEGIKPETLEHLTIETTGPATFTVATAPWGRP